MGWSETYYRDYRQQTRLAWERRARQLLEEMELFLLQMRDDADLLGLESADYEDLLERLRRLIEQGLPSPLT